MRWPKANSTIKLKLSPWWEVREPLLKQDFPLGIYGLLGSKPPRVLLQLEGMTIP